MKKSIIVVLLLCIAVVSVSAVGMENLYDRVVPQTYGELSIEGSLGGVGVPSTLNQNVFELNIGTGGISVNAGASGSYYYMNQTLDKLFITDVSGIVTAGSGTGTTSVGINLLTGDPIYYRSYSFQLGKYPGFLGAGGGGTLFLGTAGFTTNVSPYIGVGIGRLHSISSIIAAELMMKQLGVVPTEEKVEAVIELFYMKDKICTQFSDNESENYIEYNTRLAEAMGIPDRLLEVLYIGESQVYEFERSRYSRFLSGWEVMNRLDTNFSYSTTFNYSVANVLEGTYADFFLDKALYVDATAEVETKYGTSFSYDVSADGRAVYLPEDYHWWAEGNAGIVYGSTSGFGLTVLGEGHYLITPNFELNGGLRYKLNNGLDVYAGGNYRIW